MKKLLRHDLLKHFVFGFFLFVILDLVFDPWMALMFTAMIALGKEIVWDGILKKGTPEVVDVIYAVIPGLLLVLI
ncbi:MAG TPA: hypothetical protein VFM82_05820 [Flavobacteriaceae bacterium]|nr:hypothetical protein [Flavobacteriaceae bacterium]